METSSEQSLVVSANPSISVLLHPLVIMNISEHWTRMRSQFGSPKRVIGAVIGRQKGRTLELMNSFELQFDEVKGEIDMDYYQTKEEQFKQVFAEMEFLGWYSTGAEVTAFDMALHKQICHINESPIFLMMNLQAPTSELPINVYESVIDVVNQEATMLFVEVPYSLVTEEAERIGVDHVARVSNVETSDDKISAVAIQLSAVRNSIQMLHKRLSMICAYLKDVQSGSLPRNQDILRDINSLCNRLPIIRNETFWRDFYTQYNDIQLLANLGTITKACDVTHQFVNKFNVLYERSSYGRRARSMFFY